ncbi:hypothetical protein [Halobacterium litoreum]|uniref:Uncharacterized protein n=1 Tax=Halobacterium litoreum TaxID=2039234 RepID=A0ABD5N9H3_9EURY|nr:hypothetical protein [Halobacterium litoreum]UHH14868.1 hypothetical protein LT972_14775 [Halobacterium litoreum]
MSANNSERRDSVRFSGQVSPDDTETLTKTVQEPATVEEVSVRFYAGPRLDLEVVPFVDVGESSQSNRIPLIDFRGKQYVDGDDDYWIFPVSESIERDDTLGVEVRNVDSSNAYDFSVDVVVDRAGGTQRAASSLFDSIRGVF